MNVKDAVRKAIEYVADVFGPEKPGNIGLEEVVFDEFDNAWEITIGFSRPWDYPPASGDIGVLLRPKVPQRQYKTIRIDDNTGDVKSITMRTVK
uniref:Uncharacterized protein n=1 Tax=Candidatus Kentrum sp. LFY TaxID=2126342 RepID=A0A450UZE6_9GAMM|nr:MAG: hypothetical protein BECKLFY1418B_GA0070995_111011 [Candidatus Kentron sp. LFY]